MFWTTSNLFQPTTSIYSSKKTYYKYHVGSPFIQGSHSLTSSTKLYVANIPVKKWTKGFEFRMSYSNPIGFYR